jgi:RNA polymerase-binding transcription factor DksA
MSSDTSEITSDSTDAPPFTLADLEASESDMAAVQSAIDAIDAGTYGTCAVCNKDLAQQVTTNPLLLTCEDHLALAELAELD